MIIDQSLAMLINEQPVPDCQFCSQPVSANGVMVGGSLLHRKCADQLENTGSNLDVVEASELRLPPSMFPETVNYKGRQYRLSHVQYVDGMDVLQVLND